MDFLQLLFAIQGLTVEDFKVKIDFLLNSKLKHSEADKCAFNFIFF